MSIDGAAASASTRQFLLEKESELRVEVGSEAPLRIRLVAGSAEVFGAELPPEKWMTVPPLQNVAIFTWRGATIELDGTSEVEYVADETPMVSYVNVHAILDARRVSANSSSSQGPRTIVVGPADSGKTSLCRLLLNWACRRSWKPTFVDLDIGQGSISIPGCIAASSVETPMDSFGGIPTEMPVVYFYGHTSASANVELYKVLMKELAQTLERRFSCFSEYEAAGMVINTMGWVDSLGYELLLQAINLFNANVVLVLGQEYYNGIKNNLSPYSFSVNFGDINVYRIGGGPQAPPSALPIGAEPASDPTRVVVINIMPDLIHAILAISFAKELDQIISSNIAGFVFVSEIDFDSNASDSKRITFLSPCPAELPSKMLISGTLKWSENPKFEACNTSLM
ncbi:hypothetical protein KSP40_PGU000608 [Platanthera guangdongensis]|uniref:Protein CLP1 homolog n=1 Tax=Platanthera guangdongensis TaxID=2320717 RepID=A0ABR2LIU6_9ASPA